MCLFLLAYGLLCQFYSAREATFLAIATGLSPGIISPLMLGLFSETVFAVFISLSFIFLFYALRKQRRIYWFAAALFAFYSYTVRVLRAACILGLMVVAFMNVAAADKQRRKDVIYMLFLGGFQVLSLICCKK